MNAVSLGVPVTVADHVGQLVAVQQQTALATAVAVERFVKTTRQRGVLADCLRRDLAEFPKAVHLVIPGRLLPDQEGGHDRSPVGAISVEKL
jgi:hypothetical protein